MVKWWDVQLSRSIKITKMRIKHHEKHGVGKAVMEDKARLVIQEKALLDRLKK